MSERQSRRHSTNAHQIRPSATPSAGRNRSRSTPALAATSSRDPVRSSLPSPCAPLVVGCGGIVGRVKHRMGLADAHSIVAARVTISDAVQIRTDNIPAWVGEHHRPWRHECGSLPITCRREKGIAGTSDNRRMRRCVVAAVGIDSCEKGERALGPLRSDQARARRYHQFQGIHECPPAPGAQVEIGECEEVYRIGTRWQPGRRVVDGHTSGEVRAESRIALFRLDIPFFYGEPAIARPSECDELTGQPVAMGSRGHFVPSSALRRPMPSARIAVTSVFSDTPSRSARRTSAACRDRGTRWRHCPP